MAATLGRMTRLCFRAISKSTKDLSIYKSHAQASYATQALQTTPASGAPPPQPEQTIHKVTMIPGDGIGPELMYAVKEVFCAAQVPVQFEEFWVSEVNDRCSDQLVDDLVRSVNKNRVAIKGKLATPTWYDIGDLDSVNMSIRKKLDMFAKVVRVRSLNGINARHRHLDLMLIREQTEGEYSALEHETVPGVVESLKIITKRKSQRIAKFAFDFATRHRRNRVTAVHKANVVKLSDGMFVDACVQVAKLYPKIQFDQMHVDRCCMQLTSNPSQFDVMVMPNLYGNIIDNLCTGLVGGAGVVPRECYSPDCVVFETSAHYPFSENVGGKIANPTAMLLCSANMLSHMNLKTHAKLVEDAVRKVLKDGKVRTNDLGGFSSPSEFTNAVIHCLGRFDHLI